MSIEIYFRVADSRLATNKMKKLFLFCFKIRLEGPKCTPGSRMAWEAASSGWCAGLRRIAAGAAGVRLFRSAPLTESNYAKC